MKKLFLVVALGFVSLFATGCFANGSASSVAKEYAKILSNGNYDSFSSVLYHEKNSLFNTKSLKDVVKNTDLDISGNKSIEVLEVGEEEKDENGNTVVTVTLSLDNDKTLEVDTVEVDGKWYVYEQMFYDKDISVIVPKGVTLKVDGKKVGKDNLVKKNMNFDVKHPGYGELLYFSEADLTVNVDNVEVDVYVFKNPVKGSYKIELKGDKKLKDVLSTNSYCGDIDAMNYTYKCSDTEGVEYDYFSVGLLENSKVKKFVEEYLTSVANNIHENKKFSDISYYFDDSILASTEENYNNIYSLLTNVVDGNNPDPARKKAYYNSYKVEDLRFIDIKVLNNDNIVVVFDYALDYDFNIVHSANNIETRDYYTEYKSILLLTQSGDSYKVKNGLGMWIQ